MRLESYAQELEDLIIYSVLRDVENGFYIDVGANDPTDISVTKFFYDRGWHGINIEPLSDKCLLLEEMRPRDINLCVGLGNKRGYMDLYEHGTGSTFLSSVAEMRNFSDVMIPKKLILTMSDIYNKYLSPGINVHFCKIDVEGYEKAVLEGINDWDTFRPWIFVIESTVPGTDIPCHEGWEPILLENDYQLAFKFGINRYYLDIRREHLQNRFNDIWSFLVKHEIAVLKLNPLQINVNS